MTYEPKPICTRDVELPLFLDELAEQLAQNVHELWAQKRIAEGWKYGRRRDDDRKTTPCLVPYGQLPESEKDYDRTLVVETIKAILALGFRIEHDGQPASENPQQ